MPLPTPANLVTMDYAYLGQPFVSVPAKAGLGLGSMDYAFRGQPFVSNPDAVATEVVEDVVIAVAPTGGWSNNPIYRIMGNKRKSQIIEEKQDEIINLRLEAQELLTEERALILEKDKQSLRQAAALQAEIEHLDLMIRREMLLLSRFEAERRNNEDILILSMSLPFNFTIH